MSLAAGARRNPTGAGCGGAPRWSLGHATSSAQSVKQALHLSQRIQALRLSLLAAMAVGPANKALLTDGAERQSLATLQQRRGTEWREGPEKARRDDSSRPAAAFAPRWRRSRHRVCSRDMTCCFLRREGSLGLLSASVHPRPPGAIALQSALGTVWLIIRTR